MLIAIIGSKSDSILKRQMQDVTCEKGEATRLQLTIRTHKY